MRLLSVIIPFFNSEEKCTRLLKSLAGYSDPSVEIICVDDGSNDSTVSVIKDFYNAAECSVRIIEQENKGPGGARNSGLDASEGQYVWFVDSDDDVNIEAVVDVLRNNEEKDFCFIDFNIKSGGVEINTMELSPGVYEAGQATRACMNKFGRIVTKVFNSKMLRRVGFRYPEYCIYEDNPFIFILPSFVERFLKVDTFVYIHHEEYESVTRGNPTDRYYDRMMTACWGYKVGAALVKDEAALEIMNKHFIKLHLVNTVPLSRFPSTLWIAKLRTMRQFRTDANDLNVRADLFYILNQVPEVSLKFKAVFVPLYLLSRFLPCQTDFFLKKRIDAWGRAFAAPGMLEFAKK